MVPRTRTPLQEHIRAFVCKRDWPGHGDTGTRIESYCRPQPRCNCWLTEQRNQSRETKRPGHVETRRNQIDPRESNTRTKRVSTMTAMNGDAQRAVVTSRGGISGRAFANGGRSTKKHETEKNENHNQIDEGLQNPTLNSYSDMQR